MSHGFAAFSGHDVDFTWRACRAQTKSVTNAFMAIHVSWGVVSRWRHKNVVLGVRACLGICRLGF